ncbi:LamG domain-containing protein [Candidatus Woesearchaeota archaeon]|nr:LamG domain-containing protein [Candidatus Woesearchaeota archaeon]
MMLKFYELLANNDTISVYAIAEDNSRIQVISEGVVVAETTMNKGEQAWRNITITGLNTSADYVYIHSDSSIKYDYVTAYKREAIIPKRLIPAQNMSIVLTHNESIDSAVGYSSETNNVTIKDDKGNSIAKLNVFFQNAEDDINLSIMSAATNHTSMKSVVHMDSWPSEIAVQKTLYIPSTGKGAVYICPNASTLDDVYEECAGGFHAAIGNTIVPGTNRMINVVDVLLNGTRYYEVSGLVGTGGGESIEILNVHSFPILGGNWTVMFNTTGIADLKITPLNGTTFSELLFDDVNTTDDLEFQSIMCGNESLAERMQIIGINGTRYNYSLLEVNDSIRADVMLIEDYGCNSTGYFTNKELYGGSHHLLFEFGGANATAENYVSQLFCEITTNCLYTDVMHLSSLFNAHAELNTQSNYDYTICCRENFGEALGTDCAANDAEEIISLESITNSQVEKVSESNYANDVCLSPTSYYNISCDYTTDCTGYDTCVASISSIESQSNTNLQIGNCTGSGSYATKICCATEEKESEPSMTGVVLNATDYPLNKTSANLTAWPGLVTDPEGDDAKIYYNWQVNNTPIAVLNLMMSQLADESYDNQTVYDISGYGNDGRLGDSGEGDTAEPVFNSTGGYDGFGAYEFDGTNDYIIVSRDPSLEPLNEITISSWINTESYPGWQRIVTKGIEAPTYEGYSLLFDDSNILFQLYAGGSIRQFSVPHTLSLNNWHQVIATYDGSNMRIYQDGALLNSLSVQGSITHDTNDDLFIGRYRTQQGFFNGTMGDFVLYTRSLSQNQIITLYNSGAGMLNLTVSDETVKHDNWTVSATPVDSQGLNGSTVTSGPVEIINTIPTVPTLIWPEDGNASLITRVPNLNWTDSYDADGDLLTYRVNLTHDTCGSPIIYNEVGDSNKTVEQELLTKDECPGWYNWTIEAYDGEEYSLTSNVFGFQILSILILSLNPDVVDFGNMDLGDSDNTIDDSPYPFVLENQGTVFAQIINVTANASLWSSEPSPTDHFQIRAGDHEVGSINLTGSATTWVNVSTLNLTIIDRLNYSDANDEARLDLSIIVPSAETSGEKSVLMTFYGVQP